MYANKRLHNTSLFRAKEPLNICTTNKSKNQHDNWSNKKLFEPFKHQPHKMVKHTQRIRWLLADELLSVFDPFVRLARKVSRSLIKDMHHSSNFLPNALLWASEKEFRISIYACQKWRLSTRFLKRVVFWTCLLISRSVTCLVFKFFARHS